MPVVAEKTDASVDVERTYGGVDAVRWENQQAIVWLFDASSTGAYIRTIAACMPGFKRVPIRSIGRVCQAKFAIITLA